MFRTLLTTATSAYLIAFCLTVPGAAQDKDPARLLRDEGSLKNPMELKLLPSKTSSIYKAEKGGWQFNLHSYITYYDGKFWAIWSSGRVDEDSPSQGIRYATSKDGHSWSESQMLAPDPDGPEGLGRWIARGIFVDGGKLYALTAYMEGGTDVGKRREAWHNLRLMRWVWTGSAWRDMGLYLTNCMNNYPPRLLNKKLFMTCRDSFMQTYAAIAEPSASPKWTTKPLPGTVDHRFDEPTWHIATDGTVHMIIRDGTRSRYLLRSVSKDNGNTWPEPVRTNYPDATSKNFTGKLSNGWYFLINNPNQNGRDPLAISFSQDGWVFDHPAALRKGAPARRFEGRSKGSGSIQYPHAIEKDGSLWVIYSTNKEDIEISQFKIADFGLGK
ncbi:MAG: exo-alpha-sialidase [Acidobacteriota bacterium]